MFHPEITKFLLVLPNTFTVALQTDELLSIHVYKHVASPITSVRATTKPRTNTFAQTILVDALFLINEPRDLQGFAGPGDERVSNITLLLDGGDFRPVFRHRLKINTSAFFSFFLLNFLLTSRHQSRFCAYIICFLICHISLLS